MKSHEFIVEYNSLDGYYNKTDPETGLPIGPAKPDVIVNASANKVLNLIKANCSQYLASAKRSGVFVLRGMGTENRPYITLDPTKTVRQSANTNNIYTLYTQAAKSWANLPKRSQSIICSTSDYASDYGNVYAIFPYDNAPVGITAALDFWESFSNGMSEVGVTNVGFVADLVIGIQKLLELVTGNKKQVDAIVGGTSPAQLMQLVDQITPKVIDKIAVERKAELSDSAALRCVVNALWVNELSLRELLDTVFDPATNNIVSATGANCVKKIQGFNESELWIGGPCIAIACSTKVQQEHPELIKILNAVGLKQYAVKEM